MRINLETLSILFMIGVCAGIICMVAVKGLLPWYVLMLSPISSILLFLAYRYRVTHYANGVRKVR